MWHILTAGKQSIIGTPDAIIGGMRVESDLWFADDAAFIEALAFAISHNDHYTLRTDSPEAFLRSMQDGGYLTILQES